MNRIPDNRDRINIDFGAGVQGYVPVAVRHPSNGTIEAIVALPRP